MSIGNDLLKLAKPGRPSKWPRVVQCSAPGCEHKWVQDKPAGRPRRYCSDKCAKKVYNARWNETRRAMKEGA